jgi:hypothetical protein
LLVHLSGLVIIKFKKLRYLLVNIWMTTLIEEIRSKIVEDEFEFSKHAVDQSILRRIKIEEIKEAIANGEVIEDYPDDKYGPTCLIAGSTNVNRPIHVQCSHPSRPLIKIITVYQPDIPRWNNDFTQREKRNAK